VQICTPTIVISAYVSELQHVTCHMGSHSVTCHGTQVNTPRLNPNQRLVRDLPIPQGWEAELCYN